MKTDSRTRPIVTGVAVMILALSCYAAAPHYDASCLRSHDSKRVMHTGQVIVDLTLISIGRVLPVLSAIGFLAVWEPRTASNHG